MIQQKKAAVTNKVKILDPTKIINAEQASSS